VVEAVVVDVAAAAVVDLAVAVVADADLVAETADEVCLASIQPAHNTQHAVVLAKAV